MSTETFFEKQTNLTAGKTLIYEKYITGYLPKLLMKFSSCIIADLFCGPGYNGDKKGSPIILLEQLNYILSSKLLAKRRCKVEVIFNDQSKEFIQDLTKEISKYDYDKDIINISIYNSSFENILPRLISQLKETSIPKFFFLDPYSYSNVCVNDLGYLMNLKHTEVLLFLPVFHSYRFTKATFKKEHKTRKFIEEFTTKGMVDYGTIHPFMESIKKKLIDQVKLSNNSDPYIRYVLLDGGTRKNSLFLLTGHQKGMLLMNQIANKYTEDGSSFKVNQISQHSLFENNEVSEFYNQFKSRLIRFLESEKVISNYELIDFTIRECFIPKNAKAIIKQLVDSKKVTIFERDEEIKNQQKWAISVDPKYETFIKWNSNE